MNVQHCSRTDDTDLQNYANHDPPASLMSIVTSPTEHRDKTFISNKVSINKRMKASSIDIIPINNEENVSISTSINRIDISKFHFAHVIKVPHGTNLLASDNQSTTVCINSVGSIIHLITPTGYYIRSTRWPETENKIIDLFW